MHQINVISKSVCAHCGERCDTTAVKQDDQIFCCSGCAQVYSILSRPDLCQYYELAPHPGKPQRETFRKKKFEYLDNPEIASRIIQFSNDRVTHVTFFLPQIHCSSCLWLLEHLSRLDPAILTSTVSFGPKEVFITFDTRQTTLRQVVELLSRIGYEPHLSYGETKVNPKTEPRRKHWYKIGLAGFCFSNIMMLSFPEYLAGPEGIEPSISSFLNLIKITLAIPVITYASSGFFTEAWKGLKEKYLNIDAPIALALVITFGRSLYEIVTHTGEGYLDSMSGIVFFMLIGRWLQDKTYQTISFDRDFKSFFPVSVTARRHDEAVQVPIEKLKEDECIIIHHGELIPVDAMITKGVGQIDYSFVTGESMPVMMEKGAIVYAGGKQMGGRLELTTIKEASQSYLTQLWNKQSAAQDSNNVTHAFTDKISRYFTFIVLGIGLLAGLYWYQQGETSRMWNALTTILIVACPCALLLSANFTIGNMLRVLSLNHFYLRNANVLHQLASVDTVIFDKTGTLTYKNKMKVVYDGLPLTDDHKEYLAQILVHSNHPLSRAVFQYLKVQPEEVAEHFKNIEGQGMEGWIREHYVKIGSPSFVGAPLHTELRSAVSFSVDQKYIGTFFIQAEYRGGLSAMFSRLRQRYGLALLSGDRDMDRERLHSEMGRDSKLLFQQHPEDKLNYIESLKMSGHRIAMIGDGLNDVPALKASHVGIAVSEGDNTFAPAADGIMDAGHISNLDHILAYVRSGKKIILFSFAISILYNIIGLFFALQGTLSPLIAAILMPSSTITIILITFGMSTLLAKKHHLNLNQSNS